MGLHHLTGSAFGFSMSWQFGPRTFPGGPPVHRRSPRCSDNSVDRTIRRGPNRRWHVPRWSIRGEAGSGYRLQDCAGLRVARVCSVRRRLAAPIDRPPRWLRELVESTEVWPAKDVFAACVSHVFKERSSWRRYPHSGTPPGSAERRTGTPGSHQRGLGCLTNATA